MSGLGSGLGSGLYPNLDSAPAPARDLEAGLALLSEPNLEPNLEPNSGNTTPVLPKESTQENIKISFQQRFQAFQERHSYFNYFWAVSVDAAPLFGTMLASLLANSIIQHFMNNLKAGAGPEGAIYLAAASQWTGTYILIQSAMAQPTSALFSLLSKKRGKAAKAVRKGDEAAKNKALQQYFRLGQQGIIYAIWSSVIVAVAFYCSGRILENKPFNENPEITTLVQRFLRWSMIGVPAFSYSSALRPFLLILEKRNVVNWVNFLSLPLVFLLSYGFSTGNLAPVLPQWGLEGLAIAMAARSWLMAIVCSVYIALGSANPLVKLPREDNPKVFEEIALGNIKTSALFHFKKEDFLKSMCKFLKTGLPLIGKVGVEAATTILCAKWLGNIGPAALAVDSVDRKSVV